MGNHYVRRFDLSKYTLKSFDSANEFACDTNNSDAWTVDKNGTQAVLQDSTSAIASSSAINIQGATAAGAANSQYNLVKTVTGIADDTGTAVLTVTIPNPATGAYVAGVLEVTALGILGAGGAVGVGESVCGVSQLFAFQRNPGAATVATAASSPAQTAIATTSGGDAQAQAMTMAVSSISGGNTATQTFTINVTIDDDTGSATNDICIVYASLLNAAATGATIA